MDMRGKVCLERLDHVLMNLALNLQFEVFKMCAFNILIKLYVVCFAGVKCW